MARSSSVVPVGDRLCVFVGSVQVNGLDLVKVYTFPRKYPNGEVERLVLVDTPPELEMGRHEAGALVALIQTAIGGL
jgi:hypothetical protein